MKVLKGRNGELIVSRLFNDYENNSNSNYTDTYTVKRNYLYYKVNGKLNKLFGPDTKPTSNSIYKGVNSSNDSNFIYFYYDGSFLANKQLIHKFSLFTDELTREHKFYFSLDLGFIQICEMSTNGWDVYKLHKYINIDEIKDTCSFKFDFNSNWRFGHPY